jgi:hypothetical protein
MVVVVEVADIMVATKTATVTTYLMYLQLTFVVTCLILACNCYLINSHFLNMTKQDL